jgi:hypothetical protein
LLPQVLFGLLDKGHIMPAVKFFQEAVHSPAKSAELGRQIFESQDYIEIVIPGDMTNIIIRKATEKDIETYADTYRKYKDGLEQSAEGYPLEQWAHLTKADVLNYKSLKFSTVEQVAEMNTSSMGAVGMRATGDKKAAQAFIENSKKNGLAETQAIEIENLKNEVRRLTEQVKEVGALADKKDSTLHVKK